MEEADYEGFSIREYTRNVRSVDIRKCCPFPGEFTGDFIQSLLPSLTVTKFRWWSHELSSLLTKSPDYPKPVFGPKANAESTVPCKKRSIGETTTNDLVLHTKKIKTKKLYDSFDAKTDNKVCNCEEQARERAGDDMKCSLGIKERSGVMSPPSMSKAGVRCFSYTEEEELFPDSSKPVSQDLDSELQIPRTLKVAKRKVCSVRSLDKSSIDASQCETQVRVSLHLCCSQMNRLSLCSVAEDQSAKVMSNDKTSDNMLLESKQVNKFQPVVSERRLSHALVQSSMSCFSGSHLTLERIKDALDLERKRHVSQPNQSSISASSENHYRSCSSSLSQPASVAIHRQTLLNQSHFNPLLVEEAMSGFPLNLQGELVEANGSFRSAGAENDILLSSFVDLSSGTEPALATDVGRFTVHSVKHNKYYPARLGLDETFTENAFLVSDTNNPHTINLPKQEALFQNLSNRNMVTNSDGLCLHDTQSTMRLMGKDVSVKTGYSDVVGRGEIIASDPSMDYSFLGSYAQQSSWLWRTATLGESHSITSLDKSSKDPFPMFCEPHVGLAPQDRTAVVPDSELPSTLLHPCGSLVSCAFTDKDLYFHETGLGQQLNSVTFSQQQLPFPSNPEIAGLPSDDKNVGVVGLLPDVREQSLGLPFSCTDSTRQSLLHWPQSSFESSRLDVSYLHQSR
ncbi:hypothetical protein N665_0079s0020 [Sinapis alba]|nr:hypothetical protein N665_0079s0020 [Sinapis alba]